MDWRDFLAVAGLVVAVVSAAVLFLSGKIVVGVLLVAILLLLAYYYYVVYVQPPFVDLERMSEVKVLPSKGQRHDAEFSLGMKRRVHRELHEITHPGLRADGNVEPSSFWTTSGQLEAHLESGAYVVSVRLPAPARRGSIIDHKWGFTVRDAYGDYTDHILVMVRVPTKKVCVKITLPEGRKCTGAEAIERYAGGIPREDKKPTVSTDGRHIEWERARPRPGNHYVIQWHW